MKNNKKVELAIGNILHEQKNVATHIKDLDENAKRRVLMYVANFCASAGYEPPMMESVELLGFRDEEALIFCTAAIGGGRPQLVPSLVKKFCKNTAIARQELSSCARRMIRWAESAESSWQLLEAVECLTLMRQKIKPAAKGEFWNNEATNLALFILYTNGVVRDQAVSKSVLEGLRKLVPDDDVWKWLEKNKARMGGPLK